MKPKLGDRPDPGEPDWHELEDPSNLTFEWPGPGAFRSPRPLGLEHGSFAHVRFSRPLGLYPLTTESQESRRNTTRTFGADQTDRRVDNVEAIDDLLFRISNQQVGMAKLKRAVELAAPKLSAASGQRLISFLTADNLVKLGGLALLWGARLRGVGIGFAPLGMSIRWERKEISSHKNDLAGFVTAAWNASSEQDLMAAADVLKGVASISSIDSLRDILTDELFRGWKKTAVGRLGAPGADAEVGVTQYSTLDKRKGEDHANKSQNASPKPAKNSAPADLCSGRGFADPDLIGDFVKGFKAGVVKDWASLSPDERFVAVKELQEKQFKKLGIPKPTIDRSTDTSAGFDNPVTLYGAANDRSYSMTYNGNLFSKSPLTVDDQKELAKTIIHEARHLEQYYKIAQYRAACGNTAADITSKNTETHKPAGLPKDVVEHATKSPLPAKQSGSGAECPNFAKAKVWDDAKYGKGELSQYRPGVGYADRPLEKDAWGLEPTIDAKW